MNRGAPLRGSLARATVLLGMLAALAVAPAARGAPLPRAGLAACPEVTQTGFCIDDPEIQNFFDSHGQVDTFGYPVSRTFTFLGCPVQIFQRQVAQHCGGRGVELMNILDPEIFPYTRINGSIFPAPDDGLKNSTPRVGEPNYDIRILEFVRANAVDQFQGRPVNFRSTFSSQFGLEVWGAPISPPAPDPSNDGFIYQRFQRGIMHYSADQGTRGVLLADYLKQIMLGPSAPNLPGDLLEQAQGSPLFGQYCRGGTRGLCRPEQMPSSDLRDAFEPGSGPVPPPGPSPVTITPPTGPVTPTTPVTVGPTPQRAQLRGTVKGAKSGTRVSLEDVTGFETRTGGDGTYTLADVPFRDLDYEIAAQDPDNPEREARDTVHVAAATVSKDLTLPGENGGGQLAVAVGRVRGPDKAPVKDALVWRAGAAGLTRTDTDGSFQLVLTPRDLNNPKPQSTITIFASAGGRWGFATADFRDSASGTLPQIDLTWTSTPPKQPERVTDVRAADLTKGPFSYTAPKDGGPYYFTARAPQNPNVSFTTDANHVQCDAGSCSMNNRAPSKSWATVYKLNAGQTLTIELTDKQQKAGWDEAQVVHYR